MHQISADIRKLYAPVQAGVNQLADKAVYAEFLPADQLQPFIYCYWELKTLKPLKDGISCNVVSDGCMDLFFELSAPHNSFVMGFFNHYTEFPLGKSFRYIGIRFLPAAFPQLFKICASDLSNQIQHLRGLIPATADFFAKNFDHVQGVEQIKKLLDDYFTDLALLANFSDDLRLYESLTLILKNAGVLNIEKDLETGISSRHLRRLFNYYIGDTAKMFSKVVRFQHILKNNPTVTELRARKSYLEIGYYDQSHFINDFKLFYGITPTRAFEK